MAHVLTNDLRTAVILAGLQGQLTEQLSSDTPVHQTLQSIRLKQKESSLLKNNKASKKNILLKNEEMIFDIPKTWTWCRIDSLIFDKNDGVHFAPKYVNDGIPCYSAKDIYNDVLNNDRCKYITEDDYLNLMKNKIKVKTGSLLFTKSGSIGRTAIVSTNTKFGLVESVGVLNFVETLPDYVKLIFDYGFIYTNQMFDMNTKGIAVKHLTLTLVGNLAIPLPPIEEQARIVAKVNEIMAKIDEYEQLENQLVKLKEQFPKDMKDSLLRSAFEGRMTTQNKEESVDTCIKSLIKNSKKFSLISQDEFNIPHNWTCFKFSDIFDIRNGFTPLRSNPDFWNNKDVPWFTIEDIRSQGRFITRTEQYISKKALSNNTKRILPKDTVLLCCTASVGEFAYSRIELTTNQQFNGLVVRDYVKSYINPLYVYYFVQTLKDKLIDNSGKTTFNFLSVTKLGKILIPIPPIEEQQRIVDKLDELLPLVDKLIELN